MKLALFDFGSNSTKLSFYERKNEKKISLYQHKMIVNRLAKNMIENITKEQEEKLYETIELLTSKPELSSVSDVFAIGTMALRFAKNGQQIVQKVKAKYNLDIEILTGEQEASFSFAGAIAEMNVKNACVIDSGGGSTEFIFGLESNIIRTKSVNIGAVKPTDLFHKKDKILSSDYDKMRRYIQKKLELTDENFKVYDLIGVGGTINTLAMMYYGIPKERFIEADKKVITLKNLQDLEKKLLVLSVKERKKIIGLHPDRADVILAGLAIYKTILEQSEKTEIRISKAGVREGFLLQKVNKMREGR